MKTAAAGALAMAAPDISAVAADSGELLYNGIRLGTPWPPRMQSFSFEPLEPPYLIAPPAVIPIDVGRQLFVDDFLIAATSLTRTFHQAEYSPRNPILAPKTAWEMLDASAERRHLRQSPAAMVFSDGVFFDPADRLFKMWYMGGYTGTTCYATSHDGFTWDRPMLDVKPGTNIVLDVGWRDSNTVWLDLDATNPAARFKMSSYREESLFLWSSPDGIHWRQEGRTGPTGDRSTVFYNPFRKKWVYSLRYEQEGNARRSRRYWESSDLFHGGNWRTLEEPPLWVRADAGDPPRADYHTPTQLYNLDAVGYESLMLGMFSIWRGETDEREKPNDVCLGFSRDGFHWSRPERRPFVPVSEHVGDWNWANIQTAGGCCLIVGDLLHFYVSGRSGVPGTSIPGTCSTGLATLRRDGFASMDVEGAANRVRRVNHELGPGVLVTRPVRFSGHQLYVNADLPANAQLRVAVEDVDGRAIAGYTLDACVPARGNSTLLPVTWKEAGLARLAGQPVRFRFTLTAGRLFAFWVSASGTGASGGYVAAGGPAFRGPRDI